MIKTLVVDDSATMRALISAALRCDPGIEVVGEASDPHEARAAIKALNPDVLTLDVEMPGMDGLDFLERLMRLRPMPVVMVSSLTAQGTEASLRALALGAIECVHKPRPGHAFNDLVPAVRTAALARVRQQAAAPGRQRIAYTGGTALIAIGASTGGVEALSAVLGNFPENCPPTLVTQHIRPTFTRSLAERLNRLCAASVAEAKDGEVLVPGRVYLAPGGSTHLSIRGASRWRCALTQGDPVNGHRPSVDVLFASAAHTAGPRAVGVILTGMGRDGADGLLALRRSGGRTIGQDADSSIVYGMPRVAFEIGAVEAQVPLRQIAAAALSAASSSSIGAV
ncbi:MAG: chemotaxis response regulator protein-glutamate methylesterase [Pseudomonadota bacterium]|nr:chemotaxis response regulator protein-glutamate methylesterase [Pseudomonadota bacterium]